MTSFNNGLKVNIIKGASAETITSAVASCLASKSIAIEKANEASVSANSAESIASVATTQASVATTQASVATTKANESAGSASSALISKTNAATSEANALSYKNSASISATTATTKASEASASATSASTSASQALTSRNQAETFAQQAKASAKFVDSIAELKLISGSNYDKLEAFGYYTKGDGGGGVFYWDSTSTESDNGGTIIQATGVVTGRWKRVFSGAVNVKWFGAVGDGVTDDTVAIQKAADVLTDGGILEFPSATQYNFSSAVYLQSNTVVTSNMVKLYSSSSTFTSIFEASYKDNIKIHNCYIDGGRELKDNTLTGRAYGLGFTSCTNIVVDSCYITNTMEHGISLSGTIRTDNGGEIDYSKDFKITNNTFYDVGNFYYPDGMRGVPIMFINGVKNGVISKNIVTNFVSNGFYIDTIHSDRVYMDATYPSIDLDSGVLSPSNIVITDNVFNIEEGYYTSDLLNANCIALPASRDITVSGNTFNLLNCTHKAITVANDQSLVAPRSINITNNYIYTNALSGILIIDATDINIANNFINCTRPTAKAISLQISTGEINSIVISSNFILSEYSCIYIPSNTLGAVSEVSILNNIIKSNGANTSGSALMLYSVDGLIVKGNDITGVYAGVYMYAIDSLNTTISDNIVKNCSYGIRTRSDSVVSNNIVKDCNYGIRCESTSPTLLFNTTIGCTTDYYIEGVPLARVDISSNNLQLGRNTNGNSWKDSHIVLGNTHLWVDSLYKLRIKNSIPLSDTDGTIVGTQV